MKFLCVKCDEPMKLIETAPPDRGSLSVTYACPSCDHRIAMLTNPYETQVVSSLGVKIGPGGAAATDASGGGDLSKCPFGEMVQEMQAEAGAAPSSTGTAVQEGNATVVAWTEAAQKRLENIPEFVRPMARVGIEKFARDRGLDRVDESVLDEAKDFFGM